MTDVDYDKERAMILHRIRGLEEGLDSANTGIKENGEATGKIREELARIKGQLWMAGAVAGVLGGVVISVVQIFFH